MSIYLNTTGQSDIEELNKKLLEKRKANKELAVDNIDYMVCEFCNKKLDFKKQFDIFRKSTFVPIKPRNKYTFYEDCTCNEYAEHKEKYNKQIEEEKFQEEIYLNKICQKKIDSLIMTNLSSISDRFKACSFESFIGNDKLVREIVQSLKNASKTGVLLYGTTGTGKTHLAIASLKHVIKSKSRVISLENCEVYVPEFRLIKAASLSNQLFGNTDAMDSIKEADILLIDDLGAENKNDWLISNMFDIIDYCYEKRKYIIVTTNLKPVELANKVGMRIMSRFSEMCIFFEVKGEDYRAKK